jgi:hypothetical protein
VGCGKQEHFRTCSDIAIFPQQVEGGDKKEIDNDILQA